jgi:hypothetical protein
MKKEIRYIGRVILLLDIPNLTSMKIDKVKKAKRFFNASTKEEIDEMIGKEILTLTGVGIFGCIVGYTKETSIEFEGDEYINEKNSIEFYGDLTQEQMDDLQASYLSKISNEVIW